MHKWVKCIHTEKYVKMQCTVSTLNTLNKCHIGYITGELMLVYTSGLNTPSYCGKCFWVMSDKMSSLLSLPSICNLKKVGALHLSILTEVIWDTASLLLCT